MAHANIRREENGTYTYRPHQSGPATPFVSEDIPGPPFTFGNRLGFVHGEPVQGPMTQFSNAMHLFDQDINFQEEEESRAIKNVGNNLKVQFCTHQKFGKSTQLISLSDPAGGSVSAVRVANAQAKKIAEQEDEITALKEALDQAWDDIEILRIELWQRTSICDVCSRDCSAVDTKQSAASSHKIVSPCDEEPLLLLD